jgi:hypothetical protein
MSEPERIALYWQRGLVFWERRAKYAEGQLLSGDRHGRWVFWYKNGKNN